MSAAAAPAVASAQPPSAGRMAIGAAEPDRLARLIGRAETNFGLAFADAAGSEVCGYLVEGASPRVRSRLGLDGPVWEPLLDCDLIREGGSPFVLPRGAVGAGCGLAFVLGRTFPIEDEPVTPATLAIALVTCHLAIQVIGRLAPEERRAGVDSAWVDAALCLGPPIPRWYDLDLVAADLHVSLDGNVVAQGERDRDPLDAALWLAEALVAQDRVLEAGHIIATGSRVGILQVLPGQALAARGGRLGGLALAFA